LKVTIAEKVSVSPGHNSELVRDRRSIVLTSPKVQRMNS